MSHQVFFRDADGIIGAGVLIDGKPVRISFAGEWRAVFERGDVGAANMRTVAKGSSRGDGPQKNQGRVYGRGGQAEDVHRCKHGQRSVQCRCGWHCECPGSPRHVCSEAAS